MKYTFISSLFFLLFLCLTNCTEDDMLMSTYMPTDVSLEAVDSNPKRPTLDRVITDGLKVTLEFTNPVAPKKPEGGFELMINDKRTYEDVIPRINSSEKKLTMTFSMDKPSTYRYKVYARWNSGYLGSNEVWAKVETGSGSTPNTVTPPDSPKRPVVYNVLIDGTKVTVQFANFAAPQKPEGGFELMLDGERTQLDITPRVNSDQKNVSMSFNINNPQDHCYGIYARWNSGYLGSEEFCPGQSAPSNSPGSGSGGGGMSLPDLKLLRGYEFENHIGRNVTLEEDGLKVHHLGRQDGKIVSVDGVGAYRFRITPDGAGNSYRQELVPKNLPEPYFRNNFRAKWNQEYVYEMRMKFSDNYDIAGEYISFFSAKNDYDTPRLGSLTLHTEGDHYFMRQYYATHFTTNREGTGQVYKYYDGQGNELIPKVNFDGVSKLGPGYVGVDDEKGKWITWTFHVKWAYDNNGFIRIYKNGKLFHSYNGPTSFKDEEAPYVKFGLYNSYWKYKDTGSDVQEAFVDYFRVYVPK